MRFDDSEEIMLVCERHKDGRLTVKAAGSDIDGESLVVEARGDDLEEALRNLLDELAQLHEVF